MGARLGALLTVVFLICGAFGCTEEAGPLPDNLAPTTYLSIQGGDLDTLDYRQIVHWWGSDADGRVVGYCLHWDGEWTPPPDAERCEFDTSWVFTSATTDTFVVPTGGVFGERTFQVRAVDDRGAMDPVGKSQRFKLRNWAPQLQWSGVLSRPKSSLPAVSFAWTPIDLDGRETVRYYRYWLDGQDSTLAPLRSDTLIALTPQDFGDRLGERTLAVQAFDEALAPSNVLRHTWTVDPAQGRFLLIDNVHNINTPGYATEDGFWRAALDSIAPGDYFVYDVEQRGDFRSHREIEPLFSLFEGVVWYGGIKSDLNDDSVFRNFLTAERGLGEYLDDGGRVVLSGMNVVGDSAGLSVAFARERLGIQDFYRRPASDIDLGAGTLLTTTLLGGVDTLETGSTSRGAELIIPTLDAAQWVSLPPGSPTLLGATPDQSLDPAGAVVFRAGPNGSRTTIVPFLLSRAQRRGNHRAVGAEIMRRTLLD
mgnify:CR=1 FL=1